MSLAVRTCVLVLVLFLREILPQRLRQLPCGAGREGARHGGAGHPTFRIPLRRLLAQSRSRSSSTCAAMSPLAAINEEARGAPVRIPLAGVACRSSSFRSPPCSTTFTAPTACSLPFALLAAAALLLTTLAVAALFLGLAPWSIWRRGAAAIGQRWLYALGAALAATAGDRPQSGPLGTDGAGHIRSRAAGARAVSAGAAGGPGHARPLRSSFRRGGLRRSARVSRGWA